MVNLTKKKLKEHLKKINSNPQEAQLYASRLNRILNFLKNNTGLENAGVREGGSQAKQTDTRKSDIDVIFCTSRDQDQQVIQESVLEKARKNFGSVARISKGNKAVHVDFTSPECKFDLVYKTKKKFQEELKHIKEIKKLPPVKKNAIKLVKYALDKTKVKTIKGYEVELACARMDASSLPDCVEKTVTYFKGRIQQKGLTVERVLQRLT